MRPIWQWTATQIAQSIKQGTVSCEEVASEAVARMRAVNPALNAITRDLGDEAIVTARAHDKAIAKGEDLGPLTGVPVTIKDNIDVKGQSTPNGIPAFANLIAPDDSPVTRHFREAGAIIVGRTNTPEFSFRAFTDNPLFGLTKNPWDAGITCGGSSGGAGASVAAGVTPIAHGNDIGGSLRYPAFCNGVTTIKPTFGRIASFNPSAKTESLLAATLMAVQGPIARCVADLRLSLAVMSKPDARDPWYVPTPLSWPPSATPIKVAFSAESPFGRPLHAAVKDSLNKAAGFLADAGYVVEQKSVPALSRLPQLWLDLMATEMQILGREAMEQVGSADLKKALAYMMMQATVLDHSSHLKAIMERTRLLREWMLFLGEYPVLLCPYALDPPLPVNFDLESPATNRIVTETLGWSLAINVLGLPAAIAPIDVVNGAPIGVQLVASRFREDLALDAAEAIETRVGIVAERLWARAP